MTSLHAGPCNNKKLVSSNKNSVSHINVTVILLLASIWESFCNISYSNYSEESSVHICVYLNLWLSCPHCWAMLPSLSLELFLMSFLHLISCVLVQSELGVFWGFVLWSTMIKFVLFFMCWRGIAEILRWGMSCFCRLLLAFLFFDFV